MGKALIKDRFRGKTTSRGGESFFHTTELNDGYEGRAVNLQSLTEQTSLADFLSTAELADRDFTAEKENVTIVTSQMNSGVLSREKLQEIKQSQNFHRDLLRIPRRPPWQETTSADQLRHDEQMSFLEWRRKLARLQEEENIIITPYEKNLEFWRQLWRVIERSDVVVQIVDARNPLLFWCPDMDQYVREVDPHKQTLLLINKADLLTVKQRQAWAEYFASQNVRVVFWSAMEEAARLEREKNAPADSESAKEDQQTPSSDSGDDDDDSDDENSEDVCNTAVGDAEKTGDDKSDDGNGDVDDVKSADDSMQSERTGNCDVVETTCDKNSGDSAVNDNEGCISKNDSKEPSDSTQASQSLAVADSRLQTSEELLSLFRRMAQVHHLAGVTTVGMVGYPNVGKSSTINTILQMKKVPVSATPGRTKHFQTLYVDSDLMLCDCPGLVFPSFVNSKAELVVNGILPIDQLQDSEPPVELVCHRVGRRALEALYHLNFPPPEESEDPDTAPSAYDVLQAYGALRGFMSHKGNPDRPRAARYILKDFVNGKLLFCHPPPGIEAASFQKPPYGGPREIRTLTKPSFEKTLTEKKEDDVFQEFSSKRNAKAHVQGPHAVSNYVRTEALRPVGLGQSQGPSSSEISTPRGSQSSIVDKPWKKHNNRNKKEKLRRVYKELDQH